MKVTLDLLDDELRVALAGPASSPEAGPAGTSRALGGVEDMIRARRPRRVLIDFRGLSSVDPQAFRGIVAEVDRIRSQASVSLVGPGEALERLLAASPGPGGETAEGEGLPPGWSWERDEPAGSPEMREGVDIFEIDLDRELLYLSGEPAGPARNHQGALEFSIPPPRTAATPPSPAPVMPAPATGGPALAAAIGSGAEEEASQGWLPGSPGGLSPGTWPEDRLEILEARLVQALVSEESLRARLRELEGERREASGKAGGLKSVRNRDSLIPHYLLGGAARGRLVRAFLRLLEERRHSGAIAPAGLGRLAAALTTAAGRAPFSLFDVAQARAGLPLGAWAIFTASSAQCMAARGGASAARLHGLALAALLPVLLAGPSAPRGRLPEGKKPSLAFARSIHRKMLDLGEKALGPARPELGELLEDLELVLISRAFWRRIEPGPGGGLEPFVAAAALARGELLPGASARLRRLFLETFSAFPPGTWVRLASGEVGVVVAPGRSRILGPLVLSILSLGEGVLRPAQPRLVDTGRERAARVQAVVRCPIEGCAPPRELGSAGTPVAVS